MSHFMSKQSKTYQEAVEALQKLLLEEGLDHVQRAAATVTSPELKRVFIETGYTFSSGTSCLARLITGKGCPHSYYHPTHQGTPHTAPGSDHTFLLLKDGKPCLYYTQPYGITWDTLVELVACCQRHGLEAIIDSQLSWWFPGKTLGIAIRAKEINV